MSADINEFYLFHGTSLKKAMLICKNGFDPAAATSYCLYGVGCTAKSHKNERRPPENYDSIFARHEIANDRQQHHNEYVVFDRRQVYPEYIVRYKV